MAANQAPGRLEMLREFVNTIELEEGVDALAGPDSLAGWCREHGFPVDDQGADIVTLRAFREALRIVLEAHAGEGDEAAGVQALQPFAALVSYELSITAEGRPALRPRGTGADAAIAELFAILYDAVGAGTWRRLKACRKHSCRWAFYDRSKNGSGAWCDMAVCGNRVKAQRRRARQKLSHYA